MKSTWCANASANTASARAPRAPCYNHLPRLICLVLRLWRQHPIISMLINTNDVPDAIPTISSVPEMACVGVVLVVGGPPSDDAGWPVGGASTCAISGAARRQFSRSFTFSSFIISFQRRELCMSFVFSCVVFPFVQKRKKRQIFIIISYCQHIFAFDLFIYFEMQFVLFHFCRCCDIIRRYRLRCGVECCSFGVHFILIYPIFIEFNARIAFHILLLKICLFRSFVSFICVFFVVVILFWCVRDLCVEIIIDRWSTVQQPRWRQQQRPSNNNATSVPTRIHTRALQMRQKTSSLFTQFDARHDDDYCDHNLIQYYFNMCKWARIKKSTKRILCAIRWQKFISNGATTAGEREEEIMD